MKVVKFILIVFILIKVVSAQGTNKYFIGAEHVSSPSAFENNSIVTSPNYWDTVKSLGINHASLLYYQKYPATATGSNNRWEIDAVKNEILRARSHGIRTLLYNGFNRDANGNNIDYKRWDFQPETSEDFEIGDLTAGTDDDANWHWNANKTLDPNFVQVIGNGGRILVSHKENLLLQPGDYYLKVRARHHGVDPMTMHVALAIDFYSDQEVVLLSKKEIQAFELEEFWKEVTFGEFKITIPANCTIEVVSGDIDIDIDYFAIDNSASHDLFQGKHDDRIKDFVLNYADLDDSLYYKVSDETQKEYLLPQKYITKFMSRYLKTEQKEFSFYNFQEGLSIKQYLNQSNVPILISDIYPLYTDAIRVPMPLPTESLYNNYLQQDFNNWLIIQLTRCIKNAPFIFVVQAHKWDDGVNFQREPSAYEIKAMVNLGICYGAKGIMYYMFTKPGGSNFDLTPANDNYYGLLSDNNVSTPIPRYQDSYGFPKWKTIKELNSKISSIGDTLLNLEWKNAVSMHLLPNNIIPPDSGIPVSRVESWKIPAGGIGIKEDEDSTCVELGYFEPIQSALQDDEDYLYVVNRRCLPADSRNISVQLNYPVNNQTRYLVREVSTSKQWELNGTDKFFDKFLPGEGKLFHISRMNGAFRNDIAFVYGYPEGGTRIHLVTSDNNGNSGIVWHWAVHDTIDTLHINQIKHAVPGDFNRDGNPDIALIYGYPDGGTRIHLITSDNSGNRGIVWHWAIHDTIDTLHSNQIKHAVPGDFNRDGNPDIALVYGYPDGGTRIHLITSNNNGHSGFVWNWSEHDTIDTLHINQIKHAVPGDFNRDCNPDIALIYGYPEGGTRVHLITSDNNGHGGIVWHWAEHIGSDPLLLSIDSIKFAVCGDFNRDGNPDIAFIYGPASGGTKVHLITSRSNGQSSFINNWSDHTVSNFLNFDNIKHALSGDFDRDGNPDLALVYSYSNGTRTHLITSQSDGISGYIWNWAANVEPNACLNTSQIKHAVGLIRGEDQMLKSKPVIYKSSTTPTNFSVRNYPNPFNPLTTIAYQLPKAGIVTLKVYDLIGREVKVLVNEYKEAGNYKSTFNGSGLASGVYIYRLDCNGFHAEKKLILIK